MEKAGHVATASITTEVLQYYLLITAKSKLLCYDFDPAK